MTSKEQDLKTIRSEFEGREAGVADLMELYERIEGVYVRASAATLPVDVTKTSNSTNQVGIRDAHLGRDSN